MIAHHRFGWLAWLVVVNACLVAGSVLHRHLLAADESATFQPANSAPQTDQEKLDRLTVPDLSELPPAEVSPDDPLMQQIRKAASEQFPDLASSTQNQQPTTHDIPTDQALTLVAPSAQIALLAQRLKATGQLNLAAQQLVQLAALQQQTLQEDQAQQTLADIQQIQQLIIELLGH
jgi:hypothetical protein